MFRAIFHFEWQYWLRQPAFYLYLLTFFLIAMGIMSGMASEESSGAEVLLVNAPMQLHRVVNLLQWLVWLLLPGVIGQAVYRDFSSQMYSLLYAFPLSKASYWWAKFGSAFCIMALILFMIGLGFFAGTQQPWALSQQLAPFQILAYLQLYTVILLPNLLIVSMVVFAVVAHTRNIYAGFGAILGFILFRGVCAYAFRGIEMQHLAALFDPMGGQAIQYYARFWTSAERNGNFLPMDTLVWCNRLLWIFGAGLVFCWTYLRFRFSQFSNAKQLYKKQSTPPAQKSFRTFDFSGFSKVTTSFSGFQQIKNIWRLAAFEFRAIVGSRLFVAMLIGSALFIYFALSNANDRWDTPTLPLTWQMLELPAFLYSGVITILTFLYAGLLVNKPGASNMYQLIDACPTPNWVLLWSKLLALIKMQALLLSLLVVGGVVMQASKRYFQFELELYLFDLYVLDLIHFVIWAALALFVHTLLRNTYMGFFVLLIIPVGFTAIAEIGPKLGMHLLEQPLFRFNQVPGKGLGLPYSDLDGYGSILPTYFSYKLYWLAGGLVLILVANLLWVRGHIDHFAQRISIAKTRFRSPLSRSIVGIALLFLGLGTAIFYQTNVAHRWYSKSEREQLIKAAYHKYEGFKDFNQPKITDFRIELDIFPEKRTFSANGQYMLLNNSEKAIDTLIVNYKGGLHYSYNFNRPLRSVKKDTIGQFAHFDVLILEYPLLSGDSLIMNFEVSAPAQELLHTHTYVRKQGTFIKDDVFPRLGNWLAVLLEGGGHQELGGKRLPTDSTALANSFMSLDSERINFEAIVSTDAGQVAIAPGALKRQWKEGNRAYFQYQPDTTICYALLFMSGKYELKKEQWKGIDLEVYYDKKHPYNIDRMFDGLKAGLEYCSENFSPYQFGQVRIVEFAQTGRVSAHAYPNTIPFGEGAGFIADVRDGGGIDYVFGTAVHEVAHQWWGYQVTPADVRGAKMLVESLAEYVNVQVKAREKGQQEVLRYLRHNILGYLSQRAHTRSPESPLMLTQHPENYIHYPKGALAFYSISHYLGEARLNAILREFVEKTAFQEPPYTTSLELVEMLKTQTPDSLQYLLTDWFETVTFYDNRINNFESRQLEDGRYELTINLHIRKYRAESPEKALPLADFIEMGVFDEKRAELYLQKHKFNTADHTLVLIVDSKPDEVAIDPNLLLLDKDLGDNSSKFLFVK